jgi:predicted amidohydrolase YtcJ
MKRLIALLLFVLGAACSGPPSILVKNGMILTPAGTWQKADLRIRGPYIERIAPSIEADANTKVLDATGAWLTPGFSDAHGHLLALGQALEAVDLRGTASYAGVVEKVRLRAAALPEGRWIIGEGWDQNLWLGALFPEHGPLSAAVPRHPVLLHRVDGHALLANLEAMKRAGVTSATPSPAGGEIVKDASGRPTGVFIDNAEDLLVAAQSKPSVEERKALLVRAMDALAAAGLTAIGDAGMEGDTLEALFSLEREGRLKVRVNVMLENNPALLKEWFARGPYADPWIRVQTVKAYMDGALGSRGAYLSQDYADRPGHRGYLVTRPEALEALARECSRHHFMLAVHAIGDEAVHLVLKAYAGGEGRGRGFRIEHIQLLRPEDLLLMKSLGVTASVQPYHFVSDSPWLESRIGNRPVLRYPWKTLLDRHLLVLFGSDCPVESPDPGQGYRASTSRPSEEVAPFEAVKAYTASQAVSLREEEVRGTIREGAFADLTVFDSDILQAPQTFHATGSVINGKIIRWKGL